MAARSPGLDPEAIKRRKRQQLPRAPHRSLGERVAELKSADEKLQLLLEEMVRLQNRQTIFTMSLELHQITAALFHGGYSVDAYINLEQQIGPGATVTTFLPVIPGFVYLAAETEEYSSLPWWLTVGIWVDSDLPALPYMALTRAPDNYKFINKGLTPIRRFFRFTTTNNHLVDTANFLAINLFAIMRENTWDMLEIVFLKPIVEFLQERAEKETGRPFP